jgi:putative membrane protein
MSKSNILNRMLGIAVLSMIFGASAAYAQTAKESSKDAAGMTKENKAGQMSPTGQNDAASVNPVPPGGTSGSGKSAGKSASGSSGSSSGSSAAGSGANGKSMSRADQNMMREMAYSNIAEIETGKIAQSQSQNAQVKTFAQKMIDDHTKAQQDLQQLADAKGVKLPTEPDAKHKAAAKKLAALSGDKFDKRYLQQGGLSDHRNTHRLLARAQDRATDPDLKALVTKTMPIVDQHLTMAQDMSGGKSAGSTSSGSGASSGSKASGGGTTGKTPAVGTGASDSSGNNATTGSASASRSPSTGTGDKPGTATDTGTNTTGTSGSSNSTSPSK